MRKLTSQDRLRPKVQKLPARAGTKLARKQETNPSSPADELPAEPHKIGYARVSTADQDPQYQIDALLAAGVARGDIYAENASGAAGADRPAFKVMMKELVRGDILIVWKLDRLGRSVREVLGTFHDLEQKGVAIRVLTQRDLDTTTVMGRLLITIMAAVAEMERDLSRERSMAGLAAAKARGRLGGRRFRVSDEQINKVRHLGTKAGAEQVGLTPTQFAKRVDRMRQKEALEARANEQK